MTKFHSAFFAFVVVTTRNDAKSGAQVAGRIQRDYIRLAE